MAGGSTGGAHPGHGGRAAERQPQLRSGPAPAGLKYARSPFEVMGRLGPRRPAHVRRRVPGPRWPFEHFRGLPASSSSPLGAIAPLVPNACTDCALRGSSRRTVLSQADDPVLSRDVVGRYSSRVPGR